MLSILEAAKNKLVDIFVYDLDFDINYNLWMMQLLLLLLIIIMIVNQHHQKMTEELDWTRTKRRNIA